MNSSADKGFPAALLEALLKEGNELVSRGIAQTSLQMQAWAGLAEKFALIDARPLAAHVYVVEPNGTPQEYYHETGDQVPERLAELVRGFLTSGMNELSVGDRRELSRRIEQSGLALGVIIDSAHSTVGALALSAAGLVGSEQLFTLRWLDDQTS